MIIELVKHDDGSEEWWIKAAHTGSYLARLDLSPKATDTELRMFAAQMLSEMAEKAAVSR